MALSLYHHEFSTLILFLQNPIITKIPATMHTNLVFWKSHQNRNRKVLSSTLVRGQLLPEHVL